MSESGWRVKVRSFFSGKGIQNDLPEANQKDKGNNLKYLLRNLSPTVRENKNQFKSTLISLNQPTNMFD